MEDEVPPPPAEQPDNGSICALHPAAAAVGTCDHCGNFGCGECLGRLDGRVICRTCVTQGRVEGGATPWDKRGELGMFVAMWRTIVEVSAKPADFFGRLAPNGRTAGAFGFLLLALIPAGISGGISNFVMKFFLIDFMEGFIRQIYGPPGSPLSDMMVAAYTPSLLDAAFAIVLTPVLCALYAIITALVCHLGLMLVGGAERGLEATIKVCAYAYAGVLFWMVIPIVGGLAWFWMLVVLGMGLASMHRTSGWKAAFAVLYAPCLGCLLCFGGAFVAGFLGAMLMGS